MMFETRAQEIGLIGGRSPKALAARTKRSLDKMRARLVELAAPYQDVNSNIQLELDALVTQFDEFATTLDGVTEWLLEEAGT